MAFTMEPTGQVVLTEQEAELVLPLVQMFKEKQNELVNIAREHYASSDTISAICRDADACEGLERKLQAAVDVLPIPAGNTASAYSEGEVSR